MGIADCGTIALMAAFAVCVYGTVVPHLGVKSNNWNLIRSAQNASILSFLLIALASAVLLQALLFILGRIRRFVVILGFGTKFFCIVCSIPLSIFKP